MNKALLRSALLCILGAATAAGCGVVPKTTYYSLYAPSHPSAAAVIPASGDLAVSVGPVTVPDILKQAQIATGGIDGRYHLAENHRWSGELDRDIARTVAEQLASGLGTEQVAIFPWDQHFTPSRRVLIDVLLLGGELGKEATLSVRWSVIDPQDKLTPVTRRSDFSERPADTGYAAWVNAQQRNVIKLGAEIVAELEKTSSP
jgi:hypothetical protein